MTYYIPLYESKRKLFNDSSERSEFENLIFYRDSNFWNFPQMTIVYKLIFSCQPVQKAREMQTEIVQTFIL